MWPENLALFVYGSTYYVIVILFQVALMHIPFTAKLINRNQQIELAFKQVAYGILYSFMVDKRVGLT